MNNYQDLVLGLHEESTTRWHIEIYFRQNADENKGGQELNELLLETNGAPVTERKM